MRLFLYLAVLLATPELASAQSNFARINPAGSQAVGLRVVEQYDRARGYRSPTDDYTGKPNQGDPARPIQTLIWYPADKATGPVMKAEDYIRLGGTAEDFALSPAKRTQLEGAFINSQVASLLPARARAELAAAMQAHRDAAAKPGKFPVVIYGGHVTRAIDGC